MKKITIRDVAKRAGVSKGTVSAVINARNTVKPVTRDHILNVMKEMNFRPKGIARNMKNGSAEKTLAVIIKDLSYPFYTDIVMGVKKYANSKGYSVIMTSSENDHEYEKRFSHLFSIKDIKGTICFYIAPGNNLEISDCVKTTGKCFTLFARSTSLRSLISILKI